MSYPVRNKVVLITGPARNIGRAIARELGGHGAQLALAGLEPERLKLLAHELGDQAQAFDMDVTDSHSVKSAVDAVVARFGRIDVVVANAGIMGSGAVEAATDEFFQRLLNVNLLGVYRTCQATLPHLARSRGYLLAISSTAAVAHAPLQSHYCASKAGVYALFDSLRQEVSWRGIDVGVLCPNFVVAAADERRDTDELMTDLWGNVNAEGGLPVAQVAQIARYAIEHRVRELAAPRSMTWMLKLPRLVQRLYEQRFSAAKIERAVMKSRELAAAGREVATFLPPAEHTNSFEQEPR